jgi:N-acyl-phosphatidylethanolamine-hydrolysing phospholipase D
VEEVDWWQTREAGAARVTCVPAQHFAARTPFDRNRTLWCGFVVRSGDVTVYFAGDSGYSPQFADIGRRSPGIDLALIPIGAYEPRWFMERVHVNPEEAVRIYQDVTVAHPAASAPLMLGIHWGTFRLTDEPMDEPPRRTVERWRDRGLGQDRLWIARFGETRPIEFAP